MAEIQTDPWTPGIAFQPGQRVKVFGVDQICEPIIDSRRLPKLSGVPSVVLRDWRRRKLIPKVRWIPSWWIAVVKDVYATEKNMKNLFKAAKAKHRF